MSGCARRSDVGRRAAGEQGASIAELVIATFLLAVLAATAVPMTAAAVDAGRVRHAASFVSSRFRMARLDAIRSGRSVGLVFDFDRVASRWTFSVCVDGNGNGIRRAELRTGPDPCVEGPHDIGTLFPHVAIRVDPSIPDPAGQPGSAVPVRFGSSDLISFSPRGSCTSGSLYLRSPAGVQYAVRVSGITGRLRVLRYEPASGRWTAA